MSGKHSAVRRKRTGARPPSWIGRKALSSMAAVLMTTSASGTASQPALADAIVPELHVRSAFSSGQALSVPTAIASTPIARDAVAATSQAQLDAARALAAAAAAQAAAAQAAAAQAAAAQAAAAQAAASAAAATARHRAVAFAAPAPARSGAAIVAFAEQYVGVVPYSTGASPSAGFECDGLVQWVYAAFGVALPRGVNEQASRGVDISRDQVQDGDLIVYPGAHIGLAHVLPDGIIDIIDAPDWGRTVAERPYWGDPAFVRIP
ncbi:C40 family peptidase [Leifsonia sp. McL0607]|uniref:C40 family peptidase n=1 Tax=Leifsonia sp. McL0607 TaxID=3415672 RepID=UPI003CE7FFC7